jgi:hypothetical protein
MPRVGFDPTIPASKRAMTVHALDHSPTVSGGGYVSCVKIRCQEIDSEYFVKE